MLNDAGLSDAAGSRAPGVCSQASSRRWPCSSQRCISAPRPPLMPDQLHPGLHLPDHQPNSLGPTVRNYDHAYLVFVFKQMAVCVRMCVCARVCACACVRARARGATHPPTRPPMTRRNLPGDTGRRCACPIVLSSCEQPRMNLRSLVLARCPPTLYFRSSRVHELTFYSCTAVKKLRCVDPG